MTEKDNFSTFNDALPRKNKTCLWECVFGAFGIAEQTFTPITFYYSKKLGGG